MRQLLIVAILLFSVACGSSDLFRGVRVGLAAAKTTDISPAIIQALDDGIAAAEQGEHCYKAATGDKNQKRIAQARCGFDFAQALRIILARNNIGGSATADKIASYINTTILAFEEFFRDVTPSGRSAVKVDSETAERRLQDKLKEVERNLKAL